MVGGSASPVVGAVLPALFTTFAAGLALLLDKPLDGKIAQIPTTSASDDESLAKSPREWHSRRKQITRELGAMLIAFFLAYLLGCLTGTIARTQHWFRSHRGIPSEIESVVADSKTLEEALVKVSVFSTLRERGYTDAHIARILTLPTTHTTGNIADFLTRPRDPPFVSPSN
jgi:hypothetical protein